MRLCWLWGYCQGGFYWEKRIRTHPPARRVKPWYPAVTAKSRFNASLAAFYLGSGYSRFVGTLSCPDVISGASSWRCLVWLDDQKDQPVVDMTMSRSTPPTLLDLDITGHDTITFWTEKNDHYTGFMISDTWLYRSTDQIPEPLSADNSTSAEDTDLVS